MADITITKPFTISVKGECYFNALPADTDCTVLSKESTISKFEYHLGANVYELPVTGSASSRHGTSSADITALSTGPTGTPPPDPFELSFNTGTLTRVPSTGKPYRDDIDSVDADMTISGAASATTYGSGGTLMLDGGGSVDGPTRKEP